MIEAGMPAPTFDLSDEQGNRVRSSDLLGSWVVMWWFPKASTGG